MSALPEDWQLPIGWKMIPMGEVATLQRGFDLPVQDRREGLVPIYAANGSIGTHSCYKVPGPGVVTGRSGSLGKVHFTEENFWPLNTALWVKDFHGNEPKWVSRLLTWMRLEQYSRGVGVPTLNRNLVHEVEIPLPPLDEQKRIAAILDQAEEIRCKRQRAIDHHSQLGKAIFYEMFGDATTNPMGWPTKLLGKLAINEDGRRIPVKMSDRANVSGIYPYYGASGIIDYVDGYIFDGERLLIGEDGANLLSRSSPLAFIARGKYWVNNHAHVLAFNGLANLRYLEFFIEAIDISRYVSGSAQPKITQKQLNSIEVPYPPMELQEQFSEMIDELEKQKARMAASFDLSNQMFSSLQHRAFQGEL